MIPQRLTEPPPRASSSVFGAALLSLLAIGGLPAVSQAQPVVTIADGTVQGTLKPGVREFLGIPYAAAPVGSLRWRPPVPVEPWTGTLEATSYSSPCAQLPALTGTPSESEDCLYLNVWTPDPAPAEPAPVMLWIHGGSNVTGSTGDGVPFPGFEGARLYDGTTLVAERGVVVVTINYRLGVFGFFGHADLASEDAAYPYAGNQGLLDQRAAMEWVRDNISAFGGDSEKVTIFGESAGSFDVCAHMVSPLSRGLFHRAISQSGGCSIGVRTTAEATAAADAVSAAVGCDVAANELACLRAVPVPELLDAAAGPAEGSEVDLGVSVDGGFLPLHPRALLDAGEIPKVPWMLGANAEEGSIFFIGSTPITTDAEYQAELFLRYGAFAPEIAAVYPSNLFASPQDALIRVMGDSALVCSTYDVARRVGDAKKKAFAYHFARVPPLSFIALLDLGAFHGLEIAYVFGSIEPPSSVDAYLGEKMREYWTNFARKGKPKAKKAKGWPRFKSKSWKMLGFLSEPMKVKDLRRSQCEFWRNVYEASGL